MPRKKTRAATHEKMLSAVITTHLWIEHHLQEALSEFLVRPEALFGTRPPQFPMLVTLCEAHGLISGEDATMLLRVNALRNKFAHRLEYTPTQDEVDALAAVALGMVPKELQLPEMSSEVKFFLGLGSVEGWAAGFSDGVRDANKGTRRTRVKR